VFEINYLKILLTIVKLLKAARAAATMLVQYNYYQTKSSRGKQIPACCDKGWH